MTNYLGNVGNDPAEVEKAREVWRRYMRELQLQAGGSYSDEDDGRCDNEHPDSSWCESFNRGQRGET